MEINSELQNIIDSCLNPYYNGRYSWSPTKKNYYRLKGVCLNPYYNGRYSWRSKDDLYLWYIYEVLILIIMEDTHGANVIRISLYTASLNPYYNGRYSWRCGC